MKVLIALAVGIVVGYWLRDGEEERMAVEELWVEEDSVYVRVTTY